MASRGLLRKQREARRLRLTESRPTKRREGGE